MARRKILVVDDEKNMRVTLADLLQEEGYEVQVASTGEEAVRLCHSSEDGFDVVLLDVRMPGLNGVETFRAIRRHREQARIVMMSGYTTEELKRAALDEGAVAFLTKPLDVHHVLRLVGEVRDTAILVVEDDRGEATRVSDELRARGYRVTTAHAAHDALELVEQIRFDIILIDVCLPVMNGLDLYLAIKRVTPTSVAIMVTGLEEEFERIAKQAVQQTAYTFLRKPLDIEQLLGLLERIIGQQATGTMRKPGEPT